jgi:outer membrane protein TolC
LDEALDVQKQSGQSVDRSKKIVQEITETGNATLEQLQQDRNKLENVASDLEEIDGDLKLAQNQLKAIARKLTKDKIIRYVEGLISCSNHVLSKRQNETNPC